MMPIRVEFEMSREDMLAATDVLADHDAGARQARVKAQRLAAVMIVAVVALEAVLFARPGPGPSPAGLAFVGTGVLFLIWLCPTRRTFRRALRKQTDARLRTAAGRAYLGPRSVEAGRDGLTITSGYGSSLVTWRGVIDVIPTPDHVVVILPGPAYLPIPRRAFGSEDAFEEFGAAVAERAEAGGGLAGRSPRPESPHHPV
jgi:hypothetical protein